MARKPRHLRNLLKRQRAIFDAQVDRIVAHNRVAKPRDSSRGFKASPDFSNTAQTVVWSGHGGFAREVGGIHTHFGTDNLDAPGSRPQFVANNVLKKRKSGGTPLFGNKQQEPDNLLRVDTKFKELKDGRLKVIPLYGPVGRSTIVEPTVQGPPEYLGKKKRRKRR